MAKEIVNYPIKEAQTEPVINIAGRDYMVMPYITQCAVSTERVEWADKHGKDGLRQELTREVQRMEQDIVTYLMDAVPFTVTENESDDARIRYFNIMLPLLLPADTREKWGDGSDENFQRMMQEFMQRKQTGLPATFKVVELPEDEAATTTKPNRY